MYRVNCWQLLAIEYIVRSLLYNADALQIERVGRRRMLRGRRAVRNLRLRKAISSGTVGGGTCSFPTRYRLTDAHPPPRISRNYIYDGVYPTGRAVSLVLDVADDGGAFREVPTSVEFPRNACRVTGIRLRHPVAVPRRPAVVIAFLYIFPRSGRERLKSI